MERWKQGGVGRLVRCKQNQETGGEVEWLLIGEAVKALLVVVVVEDCWDTQTAKATNEEEGKGSKWENKWG